MQRRPLLVYDPIDRARSAWSIIATSLSGGMFHALERTRDDQIDVHCSNQTIVLPVFPDGPFQHGMPAEEMLRTAAAALDVATPVGDPTREVAERAGSYLLSFVEDAPDPTHGVAVRYSPIDRNGLPALGVWDGPNGRWREAVLPEEALTAASLAFPIVLTPEHVRPIGWQMKCHDTDIHCTVVPMDALEVLRISTRRGDRPEARIG